MMNIEAMSGPSLNKIENVVKPKSIEVSGQIWDKTSALKRLRGKEDRLKRLVHMMLDNIPATWGELEEAIVEEHLESARHAAHSIKGVAGNLSGINLMNTMHICEQACVKENLDLVNRIFPECKRQYSLLIQELTQYLDT